MLSFFKNKEKFKAVAPVSGKLIRLEDVKDEVFSTKMMGDGYAIIPSNNVIYAPISGKVVSLPKSLHAVCIKSDNGVEILLHVGLDTVSLNGTGFKSFITQGQKIKTGDKLLEFDSKIMKEFGFDMTVMTIFLSGYSKDIIPEVDYGHSVEADEIILE